MAEVFLSTVKDKLPLQAERLLSNIAQVEAISMAKEGAGIVATPNTRIIFEISKLPLVHQAITAPTQ